MGSPGFPGEEHARLRTQENEIVLFGGEFYDHRTDKTHVYSDLYVLNVDKQTWRHVTSPNGPLPRTSHQAVCTRNALWVFGGEFTSLNQVRLAALWPTAINEWQSLFAPKAVVHACACRNRSGTLATPGD